MKVAAQKSFEKYPEYKDSGVDSLGKIPTTWEFKRFRDLFTFSKGLNITKENLEDEGVPCVNYGEIHSKFGFEVDPTVNPLKCVHPDYLEKSPKSILKMGDFVFADTSEDIEGSGNFTHLNSSELTFAGYHTVIARAKEKRNYRFLAYLFDSSAFRTQVRKRVKGVKVYSITNAILKDTTVWLPDPDEQTAIAHFLDRQTAKIDRAIAQKERLIELLKERKQVMIQQAVTKGLDPQVKLKDSGIDWIGQIPEHWEVKKLKYVSGKFMYGTSIDCNESESGTPVLRIPNVDELRLNFKGLKYASLPRSETEKYLLKNNDILIIRTNGNPSLVGKSGMFSGKGNYLFASYLIRVKPKNNINPNFLIHTMNSYSTRKSLTHSARTSVGNFNLNTQSLGDCYIGYPPRVEQNKIVEFLKGEFIKFSDSITLQQQQIEKLKEYKATLIDAAVTGKIKVN